MKKILTMLAASLMICGASMAAQDTEITIRELRNPRTLQTWLQNNATDAESRLTSGSGTSASLALINFNNAGTAFISFQADKADDAGDLTGIVGTDGAGLAFQTDITSKGNLATKATMGTGGLISTLVGYDGIGAVDLDYGSADITDHTFVSDGGTVVIDGSITIPTTLACTGIGTFSSNVVVTLAASVGTTLTVTGTGTFTAESVHNGGIDADYITVDAGYGLDTKTAGTAMLGESTATKVEIADSGVETEIQGTLNVTEAASFDAAVVADTTLVVTGASTLAVRGTGAITTNAYVLTSANYGQIIVINNSTNTAITLPANGANVGSWIDVAVGSSGDDFTVPTISAATVDTLIGPNDEDLDSVTWGTGHRINAYARFWSDGSFWHVQNLGGTTMTYTD